MGERCYFSSLDSKPLEFLLSQMLACLCNEIDHEKEELNSLMVVPTDG